MKASTLSIPVISAINKKHQATVNKFLSWDTKYNQHVNNQDAGPKQAFSYDKAAINWQELPKREQANIGRFICIIGY